jgi:hypothetical protein
MPAATGEMTAEQENREGGEAADAGSAPAAPWGTLTVALIDDAMHPPRLDRLAKDADALTQLFAENVEIGEELKSLGCPDDATIDDRLKLLAEKDGPSVSAAIIGEVSADALRMIEEHRSFRRLVKALEDEVEDVRVCDPFAAVPDLSAYNLILLDYYLMGPAGNGDLAIEIASAIRLQEGRAADQQIVLMSSLEAVRELRGEFRSRAGLTGSAFAFIGKPDLNEAWKVKAHLGMLERARPYAPAFTDYRAKLDQSLGQAREDLLGLVDDLDIGDYAFLQHHALLKDGHPLGDYVFWLLSSQLMALAFEGEDMRERQHALDGLEFVGQPFAPTEPSTVVAHLLHSALVTRNVGPLGPHPRAKPDDKEADLPLVQLGDVFLDAGRTKAIVVMSADCHLAFSPGNRALDASTPVLLVPGTPIRVRDPNKGGTPGGEDGEALGHTEGHLHLEDVYRIVWNFAQYRAVELGKLKKWLEDGGYDTSNRDRLRPLFGLKLQQEFGAHLMRVGPPVLPPMTTGAMGRVLVCGPNQQVFGSFSNKQLMITRFKDQVLLRVTPPIAGLLKEACENLKVVMEGSRDAATKTKQQGDWQKKIDSISSQIDDDDFWIKLLDGVSLNAPGAIKPLGPLGFVLGNEWTESRPRVILEILEDPEVTQESGKPQSPDEGERLVDAEAVSAA